MAGKHLLLDFGGVCLLTPFEIHRTTEKSLGLPEGSITWMGPHDPAGDPLWQKLLAGEVKEREYWHYRTRDLKHAAGKDDGWSLKQYMHVAYDQPEEVILRPEARSLVDDVHAAGRKAGVLTNDLEAFHGPEWVASISFFEAVDSLTDASKTGILKPNPQAYAQALDELGARADEVVFVDDQPGNVRGAREMGIETIHFDVTNPALSWAATRKALGL